MPTEWYNNENRIEIGEKETSMIEKDIDHLSTIMAATFGNLEEFDQLGGTVSVHNNLGEPIGLKLTHAIYGEKDFQNGYKQFNRISYGNQFLTILLNGNGGLQEIQTNIERADGKAVYKWLNEMYRKIDTIFNNPRDFYLDREDFTYHGLEETEETKILHKDLTRKL